MMRWMLGAVISLSVISPALAGNLDAAAVNDAARPARPLASDKLNAAIVKLQILLDRARFSLGDGIVVYAPSPLSFRASVGLEIGWQ